MGPHETSLGPPSLLQTYLPWTIQATTVTCLMVLHGSVCSTVLSVLKGRWRKDELNQMVATCRFSFFLITRKREVREHTFCRQKDSSSDSLGCQWLGTQCRGVLVLFVGRPVPVPSGFVRCSGVTIRFLRSPRRSSFTHLDLFKMSNFENVLNILKLVRLIRKSCDEPITL